MLTSWIREAVDVRIAFGLVNRDLAKHEREM
jgi:hypothetical protein